MSTSSLPPHKGGKIVVVLMVVMWLWINNVKVKIRLRVDNETEFFISGSRRKREEWLYPAEW